MDVVNILKFQIKNIHITLVLYTVVLLSAWAIKAIMGAGFRDDAHLFIILYTMALSACLFNKYKKSVGDTKYESIFSFVSSIIALILYLWTIQIVGSQYFL